LRLNSLHLLIVNQLPFGTAGSNDADNGSIRQSTGSAHAAQTAAFTVSLEQGSSLLSSDLAMVIQRIEGLSERLLAARASISLTAFTRFSMSMRVRVIAERTFHRLAP
jgi:hypothetical protein